MRIVIVGGGIVGTALAARLGEGNDAVTLCERSSLGNETTAASAGMFMWERPSPTRFGQRLRDRAWSTYGDLLEGDAISADRLGILHVAESEGFAATLEEAADTLEGYGIDASVVSPGELSTFGVESDGFAGGLRTTADHAFEPTELVTVFADRARDRGVDVRTGTEVTDVTLEGGAVTGVETDDGHLEADVVVNAAGPWAPTLNEWAGVSLPLCHTLGPMLALEGKSTADLPFTLFESRRYVRPVGDARAYVGEYQTDYVEGQRYEPADLRIPDDFRAAALSIDDVVPGLVDHSVVDEWVGLRTVTPDGFPIVGETETPGFYAACGPTGLGITLAPAIADVLAETLEGTVDPTVQSRLSPDRFSG